MGWQRGPWNVPNSELVTLVVLLVRSRSLPSFPDPCTHSLVSVAFGGEGVMAEAAHRSREGRQTAGCSGDVARAKNRFRSGGRQET